MYAKQVCVLKLRMPTERKITCQLWLYLSKELDLEQESKKLQENYRGKWEENQNFVLTLQRKTAEEVIGFLEMHPLIKRGFRGNHVSIL